MRGRAVKFGDNIDTDQIIPARYLFTSDEKELARHCMEGADPAIVAVMRPDDIIVAGRNFGCGSSREHAPVSIKAQGHPCVIAESFARIFFRNAINIGLPIFESPDAARAIRTGDAVEVDLAGGMIKVGGNRFAFEAYPEEIRRIIAAGGLLNAVRETLRSRGRPPQPEVGASGR
ncbi:MAG: 3-isopropylmalate dehydratase small subunit [Planctomycetota bacterium]|nr:3-isopropylmalate dehydratase small subunit [Planctomycetota bacterium]